MENNKTKPKEVIELIQWDTVFGSIPHMSFGSSFIRSNDLNTQKQPKHTKNSSLSYIEQHTSHSFPLPYEQKPPSSKITQLTERTRTATRQHILLDIRGKRPDRFAARSTSPVLYGLFSGFWLLTAQRSDFCLLSSVFLMSSSMQTASKIDQ